ncbi:TRAP transporter small permease [Bacteroidota bacterium]
MRKTKERYLVQLQAIFERITDIGIALSATLVVFMMLAITAEVFMRRLLHNALPWVTDLTEYSLLYVTFLGAAWLLRKDGHVRLDLVLNKLGPKAKVILNRITSGIGAIICLIITWQGIKLSLWAIETGVAVLKAIETPKWIPLIIIPIGAFMLSVQFLMMALPHKNKNGNKINN